VTTANVVAHPRDTLPMAVANMTFLVNKLGEDCGPLQYIREITQNAIEAIQQVGPSATGEVIWDADWYFFDLSDGVYKLSCIDTGAGMTGPEMVKYINELSSSIHVQSTTGNFGVGAKIAAAPRNPHGLVYMSWKGGVGHMIHLWLDPEEKVYGLKRWPRNGGEFWTPVSDDLKPPQIGEHGTVVTLLGRSDTDNTMAAPETTPVKTSWVLRYLNTRYFQFPNGIVVRAREGWEVPRDNTKHNFLRVVEGQKEWLEKNASKSGTTNLTDATVRWWILKPDVDRSSHGRFATGGHIAAIYRDELYELVYGRTGIARLQAFGVIFGTDRVVLYVEPSVDPQRPVTSNTARTQLLVAGEQLDWARWAAEFRDHLPDEIVELQEEIGAQAGERDYKKKILERLKEVRDLLRFSRYKPSSTGKAALDPESTILGGESSDGGGTRDGTKQPGNKGGKAGDIYALFAESGVPADAVNSMNEPDVQWVRLSDGTRPANDGLDDRAGRFLLHQNKLLINADFRVFRDMVERWVNAYAHVAGCDKTIEETVHEWFEQQLVEAIMSAQSLKRTGRWSFQELSQLWSEEGLTSVVLPRWHIDQSIKRNLGHKLGSLRAA
jgi:hypothetical protein